MKPTDVTDEMVHAFTEVADYVYLDKEIIAAAVNAVLGDPTPITAEWLVANEYLITGRDYYKNTGDCTVLGWCDGEVAVADIHSAVTLPCKTIGQLRALEIGLGLRD